MRVSKNLKNCCINFKTITIRVLVYCDILFQLPIQMYLTLVLLIISTMHVFEIVRPDLMVYFDNHLNDLVVAHKNNYT